jgi:phage gp29-like protein
VGLVLQVTLEKAHDFRETSTSFFSLSSRLDIVSMGHEGVGSFALADVKNESFKKGVEGILNRIQDAINTQLVPQIFELNPEFDVAELPRIVHGGVTERDVTGVADYLVKLKQAGVSVPLDKDMLTYLLDQAGIPIPSEEALEHSLELSDLMAQVPQTFQMSLDPLKKKKDPILAELDVVDEVLDLLVENGAFEPDQE